MALGSCQHLTEISTRNLSERIKGNRRVRVTTSMPYVSRLFRKCGNFDASQGPPRDSFTLPSVKFQFILFLLVHEKCEIMQPNLMYTLMKHNLFVAVNFRLKYPKFVVMLWRLQLMMEQVVWIRYSGEYRELKELRLKKEIFPVKTQCGPPTYNRKLFIRKTAGKSFPFVSGNLQATWIIGYGWSWPSVSGTM
jgi:hypothetical protein